MKTFVGWWWSCPTTLLIVLLPVVASAGSDLGYLGTLPKWDKLEVELVGPASQGLSTSANPFLIQLDVTFSGPGGDFVVPAFYAGDGNGGMDGDIWRARFSPNARGSWRFSSSSAEPLLDGYGGTFDVTDPTGCTPYTAGGLPDFSCVGRLSWVGDHYLKFVDGPYWLKGGIDDPEDFLAPGRNVGFPSKQDAIDYLANQSLNSLYFMTNNVGGDGNNVSPWTGDDTEHFDVAKLNAWDEILDALQEQGIVLHLVLEDDSGSTDFNRPLYYRQMVARFGHHNGLYWNLSEEYNENYNADEAKSFAQLLSDIDAYDRPLTVHHSKGFSTWEPFLGDDRFDLTSFHTGAVPQNDNAADWFQRTEDAGRILVVSFDETGDHTADSATNRHIAWSVYCGGGMYEIHTRPLSDFRDFQAFFEDILRARSFMEQLPFWEMRPGNELLISGTGYVFSKAGAVYVVYLPVGGSIDLDLSSNTNIYDVSWYNPRTGATLDDGTVTGGAVLPFTAPESLDWVLLLLEQSASGNVAPVSSDQSLSTDLDLPLTFGLSFVDADGPGPYTFSVVQPPLGGSLSAIDPMGVVTYTPDTGFMGDDGFQWSVNDGMDESNVATTTIQVGNDPPDAEDQGVVLLEDTSAAITLTGSDPDGDALSFGIVTLPAQGALSGTAPVVSYTPDPDYFGADGFTFEVDDGQGGTDVGTVSITVTPVNDPPVAEDGSISTGLDTPVDILLQAVDVEGDTLSYQLVDLPTEGTLSSDDGDNQLTYTPDTGFAGTDSFTFQVTDGTATSNVSTVMVMVSASEILFADDFDRADGPVVGNGWIESELAQARVEVASQVLSFVDTSDAVNRPQVRHDFPQVTGGILWWEFDFDWQRVGSEGTYRLFMQLGDGAQMSTDDQNAGVGVNLIWSRLRRVHESLGYRTAVGNTRVTQISGPTHITVIVDVDAQSYEVRVDDVTVAAAPFHNPVALDTVRFLADAVNESNFSGRLFDAVVLSGSAPPLPNDPPVAEEQSVVLLEDTSAAITLSGSDTDGDPLSFRLTTPPSEGALSGSVPSVTYTPAGDFFGSDAFAFEVDDGHGGTDVGIVSITVTPVNDPPVAEDQSVTTSEDTLLTVTLTASDAEGDSLTFTIGTPTTDGALSGSAPDLTYAPDAGFEGTDSFTFTVDDGQDGSDLGTILITVTAVNDPPVAVDQSVALSEDTSVPITLAGSDPEGDSMSFSVTTSPSEGSLSGPVPNVTYTPAADYFGADAFTFEVDDGHGGTDVGTVSISVTPVNDPPVTEDGSVSTGPDTPVDIVMQAGDVEGDTLRYQLVDLPTDGTLSSDDGDSQLIYAPDAGFAGTDGFTFQVTDGTATSNVSMVTVTVGASEILFEDDFDRADGPVVGNGWVESELAQAQVEIASGALFFVDTSDVVNRPQVLHAFPQVTGGILWWEFDFDWRRVGSEGTYRLFMQLGDGAQMSTDDQNAGVGVNLIWSRLRRVHESLGYRTAVGNTRVTQISGPTHITVIVDVDAQSYEVRVDDVTVAAAPFHNPVALDTVRFLADAVNESNFSGRLFDAVLLRRP